MIHRDSQKAKFKSFLKYFDWLETKDAKKEASTNGQSDETQNADDSIINDEPHSTIKISRKVMSAKQWLTIEDWLECGLPLCPLEIKHKGTIERAQETIVQTVFASPRLGGSVLSGGNSQVLNVLYQNCLSDGHVPKIILRALLNCGAVVHSKWLGTCIN